MPIISIQEAQQLVPKLNNRSGEFIIKRLMHLAAIDQVNDLYDRSSNLLGADFSESLLQDIEVDYSIGNADRLKNLPDGPFITISNHPYGHIDGIMLVDLFGHLRPDYKIMVNQLLSHIRAMSPNFIEVVPKGEKATGPKAASLQGVRETLGQLREGHAMGFFPSGAVSDLSLKERKVRDRPWQEPLLKVIQKAAVPVVPVRFFDGNSPFFYSLGLISWKIRLLRLCWEVFNKRGKEVRLGIGETISVEQQRACSDIDGFTRLLRSSVYDMPLPETFIKRSELF